MEFIETPNGRHIANYLSNRYGTNTFFPQEEFLSFEEAREYARKLKLKTYKEWVKYCKSIKKSNNIPNCPNRVYKNQKWVSWTNWLGSRVTDRFNLLPFEEAREFVRELKLKNKEEWNNYCRSEKKPNSIPRNLEKVYKNQGWISLGDFLGTNRVANQNRIFLSFKKAREFARKLNFKRYSLWYSYWKLHKRPSNIPSNPQKTYKDKGWISWGDFLGNGNVKHVIKKEFISLFYLKKMVRKIGIKNQKEWYNYWKLHKRPSNIPSNPNGTYKDKGWISWPDFLGTKR